MWRYYRVRVAQPLCWHSADGEVVSLDSYDAYGGFGVVGSALEFLFFPTHLRRSGEGSVHRCDMSCQMLQGDAKGSWSHAPVS